MYFTDRGIEELEKRRGEEEITFEWLAEQLRTFVDLNPDSRSRSSASPRGWPGWTTRTRTSSGRRVAGIRGTALERGRGSPARWTRSRPGGSGGAAAPTGPIRGARQPEKKPWPPAARRAEPVDHQAARRLMATPPARPAAPKPRSASGRPPRAGGAGRPDAPDSALRAADLLPPAEFGAGRAGVPAVGLGVHASEAASEPVRRSAGARPAGGGVPQAASTGGAGGPPLADPPGPAGERLQRLHVEHGVEAQPRLRTSASPRPRRPGPSAGEPEGRRRNPARGSRCVRTRPAHRAITRQRRRTVSAAAHPPSTWPRGRTGHRVRPGTAAAAPADCRGRNDGPDTLGPANVAPA